jgi:hypothetical protein
VPSVCAAPAAAALCNARGRAASAQSIQSETRFAATFENVYSAESLQVPWYITSGFHDWEGNVTGARCSPAAAAVAGSGWAGARGAR